MNNKNTEIADLLFNAVNEQGYLFQEKCEDVLRDRERSTGWEVKASQYPVSLNGQDTKIDIVLHSKTQSSPELYALIECKRADPEYIYWVFGTHGGFGNALCSTLGLECRQVITNQPYQATPLIERLHFSISTDEAVNWLEAKKNSSKRISTPQNIENAFIQVLKGVGGFSREHLSQRYKSFNVFETFFVPIVVTTASLYTGYYKPDNVNISTGKINKEKIFFGQEGQPIEEIPWVLIDYGVGENVAPKPIPESYLGVDPNELQNYKTRSIFVVNSKSLLQFLSKLRLVQ